MVEGECKAHSFPRIGVCVFDLDFLRLEEGLHLVQERPVSIQELLRRNVEQFREGLVFQDHILLYHSALGSGLIKRAFPR